MVGLYVFLQIFIFENQLKTWQLINIFYLQSSVSTPSFVNRFRSMRTYSILIQLRFLWRMHVLSCFHSGAKAPHLELVSANWKVRVNIFPAGLFIAAHPALSWCLILSGSRRRLPIVRSHDHPPAKVRRWMGFKGLQETWVRPPCLLVSPAPLSEKTPSVSPCQSSAGCRSHTFQPDLFTSNAKPLGLGWDIP